jgi:3-oxoacyl-[acyl-carrier-protein] synthase-3
MDLKNITLDAINYCEPDEFVTSGQIESDLSEVYDRLKLPYGRIEMQTGIKSRGVFFNKKPSDISSMAAKNLFENSEVDKDEIDLLIHASVCRDFLEPSTASVIHHNLKLKAECLSFDLSNACLGVVNAITVAAQMIKSGSVKKALIVTGENAEPLIRHTIKTLMGDPTITRKNFKKYFANFTIGSAGVALVVSAGMHGLAQFTEGMSLSDSSAHTLCQGDGNTEALVMETDSELLMQKGIGLADENWTNFKEKMNQSNDDFDHFICHQVGIHHRDFLYKSLDLDITKDHMSFDKFGNTGSAALPLTLALAVKDNKFKRNDEVAMLGIGSGLHTIMMGLKWN